jgi:prephenate dehydrogenase
MIHFRAMELGLIGFGRFGQFAAKHLWNRLEVTVWDLRDLRKRAAALRVRWGSLQKAASRDFVLLSVPISELPGCLDSVVPYLAEGSVLMDCCSVKVHPVKWMLERAPKGVDVIGLHPLFGPVSGGGGVAGLPIVVCPARTEKADLLRGFLEEAGLSVHTLTPEEHDRAMARTLVLTQFLGKGLLRTGITDSPFKTPGFDRLLRMVEMMRHDSTELFQDMNRLNPFAAEERRRLLESLLQIHRELESLPPDV